MEEPSLVGYCELVCIDKSLFYKDLWKAKAKRVMLNSHL
jgi:hypothetical protein